MTKKGIVVGILIIVLGGVCATFVAATGKQEASSSEVKTIRFAWASLSEESRQGWFDYWFNPFMAKFPNIKVDFQMLAESRDAIKVQVASGSGPDVFWVEVSNVADYQRADRIIPLDNYIKKYKLDKIIYPFALNTVKVKGKVYAIPEALEMAMLIYNKDMLDQNGWTAPKTRAEFEQVCSSAKAKGLIPICFGNGDITYLAVWMLEKYLNTYSGIKAQTDLFNGRIKFTDPLIKGAFELLKQDWDKGWWGNKNSAGTTLAEARSQWRSQKGPFNHEGSWLFLENAEPVSFNWYASRWPSMRDGVPPVADISIGASLAINKDSKNPDATFELINFMYTEEKLLAEGIAVQRRNILCRDINPSLFPEKMNPEVKKLLKIHSEVSQGPVGFTPWTNFPGTIDDYTAMNLDKFLYGQMNLDDYLNEAQRLLDKEFAEGWKFATE